MTTHLYTRHYVSPYQVSVEMRVSRAEAIEMLSDTSGSDYTRDVFGTRLVLDPVARTLTASLIDDVPDAPAAETSRYSFFVGSTTFYDAHTGTHAADAFPRGTRHIAHEGRVKAYGVWQGERENVAIYAADLASDEIAQRIAYAIATATGNDAVMVSRLAFDADNFATFGSPAAYRCQAETTCEGDRTIPLYDGSYPSNGVGIRYTPDRRGGLVVWLVNADATVSAVK